MTNERTSTPMSGYVMLFLFLILFFGGILAIVLTHNPWYSAAIVVSLFLLPGFVLVNPNGSRVLLLFGEYKGTIKKNGLFWQTHFIPKQRSHFALATLIVND